MSFPNDLSPEQSASLDEYDEMLCPRVPSLRDTLETIEIKAQAGLCQMTHVGTREFLKDIRDLVADALGTERPRR